MIHKTQDSPHGHAEASADALAASLFSEVFIADQLARGDKAVAAKARGNVPQGATVSTSTSAGWVRVRVSAERSMGRVGPITVVGTASAPLEPGQTP